MRDSRSEYVASQHLLDCANIIPQSFNHLGYSRRKTDQGDLQKRVDTLESLLGIAVVVIVLLVTVIGSMARYLML